MRLQIATPGLIVLLTAFSLSLTSCKRTADCAGLPDSDAAHLVYQLHDTIRFTNGTEHIFFVVISRETSAPYTETCRKQELGGYYCPACITTGKLMATSDTTRNHYKNLYMDVVRETSTDTKQEFGALSLSYTIFDGSATMTDSDTPTGSAMLNDSLYTHIFIHETDTLQIPSIMIWKTYFDPHFGIIGFGDRQTHSTFYRE